MSLNAAKVCRRTEINFKVQERHSPHDIGRYLLKPECLKRNRSLYKDSEAHPEAVHEKGQKLAKYFTEYKLKFRDIDIFRSFCF